MVAAGLGRTEVGVAVIEGAVTLVGRAGTPVDDAAGVADGAGLGVRVAGRSGGTVG